LIGLIGVLSVLSWDLGGFMVVVTKDGCDVLTPRTPHFLPEE